jgi:hypothetical protein
LLITILLLSTLNIALALLVLVRSGRTIISLNEQSGALADAFNYQNRQLKNLGETIESAMDALLIADYQAASSTPRDDAN